MRHRTPAIARLRSARATWAVVCCALLVAGAACNETRAGAILGGDQDVALDAGIDALDATGASDAGRDASIDAPDTDAGRDAGADDLDAGIDTLDADAVLDPDGPDPTAVLDVIIRGDGTLAVLWTRADDREAWCPDCDADDLGDACPDACARSPIMLSRVDRAGVPLAPPVRLRDWAPPSSSHVVLGGQIAERDDGDLVAMWRLCLGAPAYTCRAEWQTFTAEGVALSERATLYDARYGGLRMAVNSRTDDVAFVHYPDLSAGRGVGYAMFDARGDVLTPWTRLGGASAFRADIDELGRGFVIATDDPSPDVPSPDCPYCQSFLCGPDPRCDEQRTDEAGLQLWTVEPGREPTRELIDAPRTELGGYPGFEHLALRTRGGPTAILAVERFGSSAVVHTRVSKDDPWERVEVERGGGILGGTLAWYAATSVAWVVVRSLPLDPPAPFERELLLGVAAGATGAPQRLALGERYVGSDATEVGTGEDGSPVLFAYSLSPDRTWAFERVGW